MDQVTKDLNEAFAGESQACQKYLAYALQAEKEGFKQVAKLFRAAAAAETVHARNHFRTNKGVNDTKANLKDAIAGEHYEFTEMYPPMIKNAEAVDNKGAVRTFTLANEVEKVHHELYTKASEAVEGGKDLEEKPIYVCDVCGYTVEGEAPDKCPVCGVPKDKFKSIE